MRFFRMDAVAIRCWDELQKRYGIAPCVILSDLNEKGLDSACELDINNAVMMRAMRHLFVYGIHYSEHLRKINGFHVNAFSLKSYLVDANGFESGSSRSYGAYGKTAKSFRNERNNRVYAKFQRRKRRILCA